MPPSNMKRCPGQEFQSNSVFKIVGDERQKYEQIFAVVPKCGQFISISQL